MKVELDNVELNTIIQAMLAVNIKGSDAITYAALLEKLTKAFDKEHQKVVKANG